MRKNIERILGAASIVIAFVLTVILLVTVFGGIEQSEFDNNLVKGLFITLAVLYFVLAGGLLAMCAFRHKTKHIYFWVVNVIGAAWQVAAAIALAVLL